MASVDTRRLLAGPLWASSIEGAANRQNPEAAGLTRTIGWDLKYQQEGAGFHPEREVVNQRMREWDGGLRDKFVFGIPEWDDAVNYPQHGFCTVDGAIYVALEATGPALGNEISPDAAAQTSWREF